MAWRHSRRALSHSSSDRRWSHEDGIRRGRSETRSQGRPKMRLSRPSFSVELTCSVFQERPESSANSGLLQIGDGDLEIVGPNGAQAPRERYRCKLFKDGKEMPTDEQPGGDIIISGSRDE